MTMITVNGEPHSASTGMCVADLVERMLGVRVAPDGTVPEGTTLGIAVAINSVVIPRAAWVHEEFVDEDAVEIVSATQGG